MGDNVTESGQKASTRRTSTARVDVPGRIVSIDILRALAAFSIVGFHVLPWAGPIYDIVFKWAIPFFFIVAGFFDSRHLKQGSLDVQWLKSRSIRLGIPYLFWTTLRLVDLAPLTPLTLLKQYLLCSPTSTLWFLWTLIIITFGVALLAKRFSVRTILIISIASALLFSALCQYWGSFGAAGTWLHENPGYALQMPFLWIAAYAFGLLMRSRKPHITETILLLLGGVLATVLCEPGGLAYNYSWGFAGIGHILLGAGLFEGALLVMLPQSKVAMKLAATSLGVYLVHPLLIRVLGMASPSVPLVAGIVATPVLMWVVVWLISEGTTLVLLRIPVLKRIVE